MKVKDIVEAKRMQRKQYLKTGIVTLMTIGICGWVTYRLFYLNTAVRYNDFVIDSAIEWLENADGRDFDDCRKDIVDKGDWFEWFVKDRKSLDKNQRRVLYSRKEKPVMTPGMKCYELKFDSKFSKINYPKSRVMERIIVESDGKNQFKVLTADYWLQRAFVPSDRALSETEKKQIMILADEILKKVKARNIGFFRKKYAELATLPDYFGWNKYTFLRETKKLKGTMGFFKILDRGNPSLLKFTELKAYVPAGRTGFECSCVKYQFSAEDKGKKENFILQIFVYHDLYRDKSAPWGFNFWGCWKEKKK